MEIDKKRAYRFSGKSEFSADYLKGKPIKIVPLFSDLFTREKFDLVLFFDSSNMAAIKKTIDLLLQQNTLTKVTYIALAGVKKSNLSVILKDYRQLVTIFTMIYNERTGSNKNNMKISDIVLLFQIGKDNNMIQQQAADTDYRLGNPVQTWYSTPPVTVKTVLVPYNTSKEATLLTYLEQYTVNRLVVINDESKYFTRSHWTFCKN